MLSSEKYKILLVDPPWEYRNKNTGGTMISGANNKYSTMSVEEVCNLAGKITQITDKNSVLFLWTTVPMLVGALSVLHAWDYKYKTSLFWYKTKSFGMGFYFRGVVEILLVGIKGRVKAFRLQKPNIILAKPGKHSEKPEEFRELINMIDLSPKIEIFATRKSVGWDSIGNAIDGKDIRESLDDRSN